MFQSINFQSFNFNYSSIIRTLKGNKMRSYKMLATEKLMEYIFEKTYFCEEIEHVLF